MEKMHFSQQMPLLGVCATQSAPVLRAETQNQRGDVLSWLQGRGDKQQAMLCAVRNESEHPGIGVCWLR